MAESLGEKLRQLREERGISISEVAEQTRISPLYIESIEKDDYKVLPGGIFNKGFVRSYAKYIGFDEQEALQEYSKIIAVKETENAEEFRSYKPEVLTDDRSTSSLLPTILFAGIILAMMTVGILLVVNYIQNQPDSPSPQPSPQAINANGATVEESEPQSATPDDGQPPSWETVKIEFTPVNEPISLRSVVDGRSSENLLQPGQPMVFEPKQSLKLVYARSRAPFATLKINGKAINLPPEPPNPRRGTIEFDITQQNLEQVWRTGAVTFEAPQAAAAEAQSTRPAESTATPVVTATAVPPPASTPRPAPASTPARPRTVQTPIIVGGSNRATPRPSP